MKLTKKQLKQIIKEELNKALKEGLVPTSLEEWKKAFETWYWDHGVLLIEAGKLRDYKLKYQAWFMATAGTSMRESEPFKRELDRLANDVIERGSGALYA